MNLSKTTQQQTSFNVLLIGDSCIDEYKIGTINRLSPEAPVPVIKITETKTVPGMAENVKQNFENLGIYLDFITNDEVITKTRYIDRRSGQHMLRVDNEPEVAPWSGRTPFSIDTYDAVVISDYNKGFLTYEHIESIIEKSRHGVNFPVFIDTKKTDVERFQGAWVKINELEYSRLKSECSGLIVTLGERGAKVPYHEIHCPTKSVEVMDVCGCGDTFLAALTAQYLFTKDIEKAIIFANVAAGITVQHRGNYAPSYDEIRNAGY
jgi:D-beta-D-heptose 7-phosphate kinase/D-beta-D-heptose 1-phosphate adenosyltransferase